MVSVKSAGLSLTVCALATSSFAKYVSSLGGWLMLLGLHFVPACLISISMPAAWKFCTISGCVGLLAVCVSRGARCLLMWCTFDACGNNDSDTGAFRGGAGFPVCETTSSDFL